MLRRNGIRKTGNGLSPPFGIRKILFVDLYRYIFVGRFGLVVTYDQLLFLNENEHVKRRTDGRFGEQATLHVCRRDRFHGMISPALLSLLGDDVLECLYRVGILRAFVEHLFCRRTCYEFVLLHLFLLFSNNCVNYNTFLHVCQYIFKNILNS